jgi:hypothetical protein
VGARGLSTVTCTIGSSKDEILKLKKKEEKKRVNILQTVLYGPLRSRARYGPWSACNLPVTPIL